MNTEGTRGRDGTEDLRFCNVMDCGGAGNSNSIFSSKVILLVSFGSIRLNSDAVFGMGGRGGRFVGLPIELPKIDF